mgnify:CR=1 FL=1
MAKLDIKQNKALAYLKEVRAEMNKVAWPTRQQAIKLTLVVVGVTVTAAIFVGGLDYVFAKLITLLLKK